MTNQSVIRKRERRPQARPQEILMAALALFSEKGFSATRMDDVASKAGLSKGALYLYFPDKVTLLKALVLETAGNVVGAASAMIEAHEGPIASLLPAILGLMAETIESTQMAAIIKLVLTEGRAHPEIGKAYLEHVIGRGFRLMEGLIARGIVRGEFRRVDPAMTVRSFIAPMLLAAFWKTTFEPLGAERLAVRTLASHHAEMILRALKP